MAYKFNEWKPNTETTRLDAKRKEYETPYTDPESVKALYNKATDFETNNNPGEWDADANGWQDIQNAYNEWNNRKAFSYDLNGDALYQQYKDKFINQGRLAMADTMGQASAMTGGYGNSYAATVGNQTYQGYLQQLNNKIPELYQLALDKYNSEGDQLARNYSVLSQDRQAEYGEWGDKYNRLVANRDYYSDEYNRAYNEAYNDYLRKMGYSVKEPWTWKRVKKLLIGITAVILILFIAWQIPAVRNPLVELYNENVIVKSLVDIIKGIIDAIFGVFKSN